LKTYQFI